MWFLTLLPLAASAASTNIGTNRTILHGTSPSGWTRIGRAPLDTVLKLRLTLPSADPSLLHSTLSAVSTPGHPSYGQHLSRSALGAIVSPHPAHSSGVASWLESTLGLTSELLSSVGGDVISFPTTVGEAEKLLAPAEYWIFESKEEPGRQTIRTMSWGVPESLEEAVESVHPTTLFPPVTSRKHGSVPTTKKTGSSKGTDATAPSSCANNFTPDCARTLYNLGNYSFPSASKNGIAIYSEGASSSTSDMKAYLTKYNKANANFTWKNVFVDGAKANAPSDYDSEETLDLDVIIGLTAPTPVTVVDVPYSTNDLDEPGQWLDFVDYLLNLTTVPTVASVSYGTSEAEMFKDSSAAKVSIQLCNAFAQLGSRGVSVLFASGDSGAGGTSKQFDPDFPSSCPYVTAVGATEGIPEEVASFSGGGFSNQFGQPDWQAAAVSGYLKLLGSTDKGAYNASGRAYPDVAAFGVNWATYEGGFTTESGTSASCPNVAAIIAALNDVQITAGKSPLGFLNPWIYQTASSAWNDITVGSNDFPAKAGWDAATGFGTPDFVKLQKFLP